MKPLMLVAVLLIILPVNGQEKRPQSAANQANSKPESPASQVVVVDQENTSSQQDRATAHPQSYLSRLLSAENLPNLGLFVVGVCGVIIAVCTLKAIQRQLEEIKAAGKQTEQMIQHAGKQADAASLSAKIFRNSERPWILIYSQHVPNTEASALIAKNCGHSPARLVLSSEDNWKFVKPSELIDWRPERPNYGIVSPIQDPIIILPGEGTYILNITDWDVRRNCESEDRFKAVESGSLSLYIFGKLAYRDLLNADSDSFHETAWCCHYLIKSENCLSMFGLPGYSYHT
jgi:hypothetical protein